MKDVQKQLSGMVAELRRRGCVRSEGIAAAFGTVPRHLFLPNASRDRAYVIDEAIPTHFDQDGLPVSSSSAPTIMAVMLEMLATKSDNRVLEIGAGTGYNAALLAQLVGPAGSVVSIDIDPMIAAEAQDNALGVGSANVTVLTGDGWLGFAGDAFERIIVTAECWDISPHWVGQLREGGLLVLPLWLRPGLTFAVAFEKVGQRLESRALASCGFMPLQGPHGGPTRRATVQTWPDPTGLNEDSRMVAVFDDVSADRVETIENLLREPPSITSAPPLSPGWHLTVALEERDPIALTGLGGKFRRAVGLYDADEYSLAAVEGEQLISFGGPSCQKRLEAALRRSSQWLDPQDLHITAVPHPASGQPNGLFAARPSFDLTMRKGSDSRDR